MAVTSYYVMQVEKDADDVLTVLGEAEASTGEAAIRKVADNLDGRFVAVPVRNWTEIEFELVERAPIVKATYLSAERAGSTPSPIPGQTTIESEVEAAELAAEIEGDEEFGEVGEQIDAAVEARKAAAGSTP